MNIMPYLMAIAMNAHTLIASMGMCVPSSTNRHLMILLQSLTVSIGNMTAFLALLGMRQLKTLKTSYLFRNEQ